MSGKWDARRLPDNIILCLQPGQNVVLIIISCTLPALVFDFVLVSKPFLINLVMEDTISGFTFHQWSFSKVYSERKKRRS